MNTSLKSLAFGALSLLAASPAKAAVIVLQPSVADLYDLDHYSAYQWNINRPDLIGKTITSASLFFDNIRDWTVEANVLYIQLMNTWSSVANGINVYADNQASGNYFGSTGVNIQNYYNLPTYAQDLTYNFSAAEIATLSSYLADGKFSLGFDPDCHFFNDGIKLTINTLDTPAVPEPGSLALLGAGLAGAFLLRRRARA